MSDTDNRLARLEVKIAALEDQMQLYQLMSLYGPLVDSGAAEATAALWVEHGVYDWGGGDSAGGDALQEGAAGAAHGRAAIADMVRGPYHQQIIAEGAGHVIGLPHIVLNGDEAVAVSYSRLYRRDGDNFRVWRVAANRWEFVRTAQGWKVTRRINRLLDGSAAARELLNTAMAQG